MGYRTLEGKNEWLDNKWEQATSTYLLFLYFVLLIVDMRGREIKLEDNKVVCDNGKNIGLGTRGPKFESFKIKNLQSLKWC